jgi:hypothetical protein
MHMTVQKLMGAIGIIVVLTHGSAWDVRDALAKNPFSSDNQAVVMASVVEQCPTNLSSLQPKMEKALQFIKSASFRNAMLASLKVSIPEAIEQSDGLAQQITFLKHEIVRQERERAHAEEVAREGLADPSHPLKPCRHGKEGSYCHAMDQYLVSIAANLANQAFLDALQCYGRAGVR